MAALVAGWVRGGGGRLGGGACTVWGVVLRLWRPGEPQMGQVGLDSCAAGF